MVDKNRVHVTVFSSGERTKDLAVYAIKKLGFKNLRVLHDPNTSFAEKLTEFVEKSYEEIEKYDFFLRTDADEIIYDDVLDFISIASKNKDVVFAHGFAIDAFMLKPRGGGPKLFSKKAIKIMKEKIGLIKECSKPESKFVELITEKHKNPLFMTIQVATCLHEYEQLPSKVCNSFINRLKRGHSYLYDINSLLSKSSVYQPSFISAIDYFNRLNKDMQKNNLSRDEINKILDDSRFIDLSHLDDPIISKFPDFKKEIQESEFEKIYLRLKEEFENRKKEL